MKVGFAGAGKVGCSLGMLFSETQHNLSGFYSRTSASAEDAAVFTKSKHFQNLETLIEESDTVFITVPDDAISEVWDSIKCMHIAGKLICHCSGSLSSKIFKDIEKTGAYGFSIHPLLAVSDRYRSYQELPKALFTIEGDADRISAIETLLEGSGIKHAVISADVKTRYHGAAVMCSNLVIALIRAAEDELRLCGFSEEQLREAITPLLLGNVNKVLNVGTGAALTGPIERNDFGTVEKHLKTFQGIDKEVYRVLSKKTLDVARQKHPNMDYGKLELLLNNQEDQ